MFSAGALPLTTNPCGRGALAEAIGWSHIRRPLQQAPVRQLKLPPERVFENYPLLTPHPKQLRDNLPQTVFQRSTRKARRRVTREREKPATVFDEALELLKEHFESVSSLDAPTLMLRLRKAFPAATIQELGLAAETFMARQTAPCKLGEWARSGFFSSSLLEQASREPLAKHRAEYFRGLSHVLELGTGTGSDTAALARVCGHVTTIDADPVASELARRNLVEVQGLTNITFLTGNAQDIVPSLPTTFDGLFADPARRNKKGQRFKDANDYSPPLPYVVGAAIGNIRAIKVSPGLFIDLPTAEWSRQFVGFGHECLEQTLWYGPPIVDSSVVLADCGAAWAPRDAEPVNYLSGDPATAVRGFLLEAHGAINRSQYLELFFRDVGATPIAPDVAYGISDKPPPASPLVRTYKILDTIPFTIKRLRAAIAARGWSNRTELKKRNFPLELETIRAQLKLPPHSHSAPFGVLFFFRCHDAQWVVVAERGCE